MKIGTEYLASREKRAFDVIFARALQPPSVLAKFIASRSFIPEGNAVIFQQTRIGINNEPFEIDKIRTLLEETRDIPLSRLADTYRRLGVDELTQIRHVLEGK